MEREVFGYTIEQKMDMYNLIHVKCECFSFTGRFLPYSFIEVGPVYTLSVEAVLLIAHLRGYKRGSVPLLMRLKGCKETKSDRLCVDPRISVSTVRG